jgi:hypothetical protein
LFDGPVVFNQQVEFNLPPLFNADMGGFALIKQGDKRVEVVFGNPYIAQPVVNATISFQDSDNISDTDAEELFNSGVQSIVVNKSQNGFTILLNKNAPRDIRFSWTALAIKDAHIYESVVEGLDFTPPQAPEPSPSNGDEEVPSENGGGEVMPPDEGSGGEIVSPEPTPQDENGAQGEGGEGEVIQSNEGDGEVVPPSEPTPEVTPPGDSGEGEVVPPTEG